MKAQAMFFFYPLLFLGVKEEKQSLFIIDTLPSACGRSSDQGPSAFLEATSFSLIPPTPEGRNCITTHNEVTQVS